MRLKTILSVALLTALAMGCGGLKSQYYWKAKKSSHQVRNQYVSAKIIPHSKRGKYFGYEGFALRIHNVSGTYIRINWDELAYVTTQGEMAGEFLHQDMKDGHEGFVREYSILKPGAKVETIVYPMACLNGCPTKLESFHAPMPLGINGATIGLHADGEHIQERLLVDIKKAHRN